MENDSWENPAINFQNEPLEEFRKVFLICFNEKKNLEDITQISQFGRKAVFFLSENIK